MAINPFRKGGTDTVPVNEGGTGATVAGPAATPGTALNNLGALDTAAHALIDHTGIPGVGAGSSVVLETTSTTAQINTALSTYQIVYLKPGNYPTQSGQITIPADKSLIALSAGPQDGTSYGAVLSGNQSSTFVSVGRGSTMSGIAINAGGVGGAPLVSFSGGSGWSKITNCFFRGPSWSSYIIDATPAALLLENIGILVTKNGSVAAVRVTHTSGSNEGRCSNSLRNIRVEFSGGAGSRIGIQVSDGTIFENCYVTGAGSHGFSISEQFRPTSMFGCVATGCGGNGFHHASSGIWIAVYGCLARSNTGIGFNFPFGGTVIGSIVGNRADTNTGGNYTIGPAYNSQGNA